MYSQIWVLSAQWQVMKLMALSSMATGNTTVQMQGQFGTL